MPYMNRLLVLFLVVMASQSVFATDLIVPDEFPTIQAAVDASGPGDRILVRPGTWVENIEVSDGTLVIESFDGPEETILTGDGSAGFLLRVSGSDTVLQLRGLTLMEGFGEAGSDGAGPGGGMLVEDASVVVNDSRFIDNEGILGGALSIIEGSAQIEVSVFEGNHGLHGGAIYVEAGQLEIIDSDFHDNAATNFGGAVAVFWSSDATVLESGFWGNTAGQFGGAIYANHAELDLRHLQLVGNGQAEQGESGGWIINTTGGGAVYTINTTGRLESSRVLDNIAFAGTGIYVAGGGTLEVINNLFTGNGRLCDCGQGVIYANAASPLLTNNTVVDNGGLFGLFTTFNAFPVIRNSIIASAGADASHFASLGGNGLASIDHSLLQGAPSAAEVGENVIVIDGLPGLDADADFTPLPDSLAIDAGLNEALPADIAVDLLGNARFVDLNGDGAVVDLGAVERQADQPPEAHDSIFHHNFRSAP